MAVTDLSILPTVKHLLSPSMINSRLRSLREIHYGNELETLSPNTSHGRCVELRSLNNEIESNIDLLEVLAISKEARSPSDAICLAEIIYPFVEAMATDPTFDLATQQRLRDQQKVFLCMARQLALATRREMPRMLRDAYLREFPFTYETP